MNENEINTFFGVVLYLLENGLNSPDTASVLGPLTAVDSTKTVVPAVNIIGSEQNSALQKVTDGVRVIDSAMTMEESEKASIFLSSIMEIDIQKVSTCLAVYLKDIEPKSLPTRVDLL